MTTKIPSQCFLCTAPMPDEDDAAAIYLIGQVDGAIAQAKGTRRTTLCEKHEAQLQCYLLGAGMPKFSAPPTREITNELAITSVFQCAQCLRELPPGVSPKEYARVSVGGTSVGVQVWCTRHESNVVHINFQGAVHPANITRLSTPEELKEEAKRSN